MATEREPRAGHHLLGWDGHHKTQLHPSRWVLLQREGLSLETPTPTPPGPHEGTAWQLPHHPVCQPVPAGRSRSLLADEVGVEGDEAAVNLHQAPQHEEGPSQVVLALRPVAVHRDVQAVPELQPAAGSGRGSAGVPRSPVPALPCAGRGGAARARWRSRCRCRRASPAARRRR